MTELTAAISHQHSISVITSRQLSSDPAARLKPEEKFGEVRVVRLWTTRLGRSSLWRKAVDYFSFYCSVLLFLMLHVARNDIVVLKTDPPLLQLMNTSVIRLRGGKVINWLQDLYPEIALRLGKFPAPAWVANVIARWRDRALRAATINVVVSDAMERYLRERGVTNTQLISNWADEDEITPVAHEDNPLRAEWGLRDKFTVMYSGNFGRAHAFSEIAEAVELLAAEPDVHFVFVGEGAEREALKRRLEQSPSRNFVFKPFQTQAALRFSLGAADLHLVTLMPGMEELLMPSKVYGILAAGRVIGFVGDSEGALASMISRENVGFFVPVGHSKALAQAILQFKLDPALRAGQEAAARALFAAKYTGTLGAERWHRLLDEVKSSAV